MSIFSRARDATSANLDRLIGQSEDPLKTVRLIISEMEDTLVEARSTAVRALARKSEIQREIAERRSQAADWARKAELAVSKNREDLARGALAVKLRVEAEIADLEKLLPPVEAEIKRLESDLGELRAKLGAARSRQRMLMLRGEAAEQRRDIKQQIHEKAPAHGDAMKDLAREIDHVEAQAE